MPTLRVVLLSVSAALLVCRAPAQQPSAVQGPPAAYQLGPDDVISIKALDAEEISDKSIRINSTGYIHLPMVGRVRAGGRTIEQLEEELAQRLKPFLLEPQVSVNVVEMRSQPVSVIGAVRNPGVQQLQGRKTLVEMLSLAGGLREDAGYSVRITRQQEWGKIPLPGAAPDATGKFSVAELSLKQIMEAKNPAVNIEIMPNDVISVPRGEMVYVIGQVRKPGGFVLSERERISVLQALSLAEGLDRTAAPGDTKILRASGDGASRTEIPIDLRKVLAGKSQDTSLQPDDILFIPNSRTKSAVFRSLEAAVQMGTGIVIYRR